ncbi:MAG TPA: tRNA (guanosine(46)-N7)-methyltransferase TrmB [Ilumatobacteraceae bacterium]|nr:tRNA (guanosine(46)-N7)-methyltransferase TrmB [Ilumatobacteraceae bacterium]
MTRPTAARSFRPRRRGLSPAQQEAFDRDAPRWSIDERGPLLDLAVVFPDHSDVVLDVGFGAGEALIALAASRPDQAVIGVEIHTPGLARVVQAIEHHRWSHVRIARADALDLMPRIPLSSLAGIRLWFPDPWPKQRQRHRRIVRPDVVTAWVDRLRVGGWLHLATDIDDYAEQVVAVMGGESRLRGCRIERPEWRPVTRFEARGRAEGRVATDLWYERSG